MRTDTAAVCSPARDEHLRVRQLPPVGGGGERVRMCSVPAKTAVALVWDGVWPRAAHDAEGRRERREAMGERTAFAARRRLCGNGFTFDSALFERFAQGRLCPTNNGNDRRSTEAYPTPASRPKWSRLKPYALPIRILRVTVNHQPYGRLACEGTRLCGVSVVSWQ